MNEEQLKLYNQRQDQIFKAGGIAGPKFNSVEDYAKFLEITKDDPFFRPSKVKLPFEASLNGDITFDIPPRYKK